MLFVTEHMLLNGVIYGIYQSLSQIKFKTLCSSGVNWNNWLTRLVS